MRPWTICRAAIGFSVANNGSGTTFTRSLPYYQKDRRPQAHPRSTERAGATIVEKAGASHAVAGSLPEDVADLIRDA